MNEVESLKCMYERVKQVGVAKLWSAHTGPGGMRKYTLRFQMDSSLPPHYPITGAAELEFAYDESRSEWSAMGMLFGAVPKANDPKTFLSLVRNAVHERTGVQTSFLERATLYAERYRGDLDNFAYKLGLDTVATGTMQTHERGAVGPHYHWFSNREDVNFNMWFSRPTKPTQFGYEPENRFGFFEPTATHQWLLTAQNLSDIRQAVAQSAERMERFCSDLSACI